jgi:hypothetical protein
VRRTNKDQGRRQVIKAKVGLLESLRRMKRKEEEGESE